MTLKAITMNGQPKRFLTAVELIEAVATPVQRVTSSAQRASVPTAVRTPRTATFRLVPHFTCSAESCYESENAIKLRIKRRKLEHIW